MPHLALCLHFFNPVFQVSTAKNEINLFNNHILIVASRCDDAFRGILVLLEALYMSHSSLPPRKADTLGYSRTQSRFIFSVFFEANRYDFYFFYSSVGILYYFQPSLIG